MHREPKRRPPAEAVDLSDREVDAMWNEIVTTWRRPKLERAMASWTALGESYRSLGPRSST